MIFIINFDETLHLADTSTSEEKYHDEEQAVPLHDESLLFEFLILEGAQASLIQSTILNKRNENRKTFDNFDIQIIARCTAMKIDKLLLNSEIVRNKLKVNATVTNAKDFFGNTISIWQL